MLRSRIVAPQRGRSPHRFVIMHCVSATASNTHLMERAQARFSQNVHVNGLRNPLGPFLGSSSFSKLITPWLRLLKSRGRPWVKRVSSGPTYSADVILVPAGGVGSASPRWRTMSSSMRSIFSYSGGVRSTTAANQNLHIDV